MVGIPDPHSAAWLIHIDLPAAEVALLRESFTPEEAGRARRFVRPEQGARWLCARACLRLLLSQTTGISPLDIRFGVSSTGKPYLLNPETSAAFNLSHSGEYTLIAVTTLPSVGVDVETIHPGISIADVARSVFSPSERLWLDGLDTNERTGSFFRLWTLKEAIVKARGSGVADLASLNLPMPLDESSEGRWQVLASEAWYARELRLVPGVCAAIALPAASELSLQVAEASRLLNASENAAPSLGIPGER
jgi:4'-phosphopantetheinyl transferase